MLLFVYMQNTNKVIVYVPGMRVTFHYKVCYYTTMLRQMLGNSNGAHTKYTSIVENQRKLQRALGIKASKADLCLIPKIMELKGKIN